MKRKLIPLLIFFNVALCIAQSSPEKVVDNLSTMTDQYDKAFTQNAFKEKLTLIYVNGIDDPFSKVYDKLKGKTLIKGNGVLFAGAFKDIMPGVDHGPKQKHLAEAMVSRYGKDHFSILFDLDNKLVKDLALKGLSIVTITKGTNKVKITDFGDDRKKFFDAINSYFNQ
jgi:hypothetical protein